MPKAVFNPLTGKFDLIGMTAAELAAYVKISGDTMTGDLTAPAFHATEVGDSEFNGNVQHNGDVTIKQGQKLIFDGGA